MEWWKVIIIFVVFIFVLGVNIGVAFFKYCQKESSYSKEPGYRLKKARSKNLKREHNNEIKKVIKDCRREYKDSHSYFSVVVYYKYFDTIKNALKSWCEVNNIDYDWTDYDNGLGMTIRIDFK